MLLMRKELTLKYRILTLWRQVAKHKTTNPKVSSPKILKEDKGARNMISKYEREFYASVASGQIQSIASEFATNSSEDLEA
jgi:hypothetical protein